LDDVGLDVGVGGERGVAVRQDVIGYQGRDHQQDEQDPDPRRQQEPPPEPQGEEQHCQQDPPDPAQERAESVLVTHGEVLWVEEESPKPTPCHAWASYPYHPPLTTPGAGPRRSPGGPGQPGRCKWPRRSAAPTGSGRPRCPRCRSGWRCRCGSGPAP